LLILEWILTVLSIVGVILNIKRKVLCFYIWAISNIGWIFLDYKAELYGQAVLFFIYFILALWGIYEWQYKKKDKEI
jgi:nicotinamide riboside transporter PnuC